MFCAEDVDGNIFLFQRCKVLTLDNKLISVMLEHAKRIDGKFAVLSLGNQHW